MIVIRTFTRIWGGSKCAVATMSYQRILDVEEIACKMRKGEEVSMMSKSYTSAYILQSSKSNENRWWATVGGLEIGSLVTKRELCSSCNPVEWNEIRLAHPAVMKHILFGKKNRGLMAALAVQ